jgi:hypothetical protein
MQSIANKIKELLKEPANDTYSSDGVFFTPYPNQETIQAIAQVASVSYANHAKKRSVEDAQRLVKQLAESKHASPFCMAARPVYPGQVIKHTRMNGTTFEYFIFDNFEKEISSYLYGQYVIKGGLGELLDTDNYHGWVSLRRLEGL